MASSFQSRLPKLSHLFSPFKWRILIYTMSKILWNLLRIEQSVAPPFFEFLQMSVVEATYGNLALSPRKPRSKHQPSTLPTLMYH